MSHPNLWRKGDKKSPRFQSVRKNRDIQVDDHDNVIPGTGGLSTFDHKLDAWPAIETWYLPSTVDLAPSGLIAVNDELTHWNIEPTSSVPWDTYRAALQNLNPLCVHYDGVASDAVTPALAAHSAHPNKATRFAYEALATVVREHVPVADDWDANDYAYVATLARALDAGTRDLQSLVWSPDGAWHKRKVFATAAVEAYIAFKEATGPAQAASGDDQDQDDFAHDHEYLRQIFRLRESNNVFSSANAISADA